MPEKQDETSRLIEAFRRVARFVTVVSDLNRLLQLIMEESAELMESDASACMLYDKEDDSLFFEAAVGEKADQVKEVRLKRGNGIAWRALEENKTITVNDVQADPTHYNQADQKSDFVTRNLIATPMRYHGEIVGVLEVLNRQNDTDYSEQDALILETISEQAAMAITNARLVNENLQQERLAATGLAVNGIAHHLKNILIAFKGPLSLIHVGLENDKMDMIERSLGIMDRGAKRMEESLKQMLAYSKDRKPERVLGSLNELLAEVVEGCADQASEAGVELRSDFSDDIKPSYIDWVRLHDAVLNLVGNAIEAQPNNIADAWVEVRSRIIENGKRLQIEVEDNGPGIPKEKQASIFQPFFSTKGSKGTGLGLAVARKVAQENGGDLAVESDTSSGTLFKLTVEAVNEPDEDPEADAEI